jgi:hypothetical protein
MKSYIRPFKEFIKENTPSVYNKIISDTELEEFMSYLIHDKSHVMDNKSPSPRLEKVLQLVKGQRYDLPLYRGLYTEKEKDFTVGEVYEFPRYQSFSEKIEIAKRFSVKGLILKAITSVNGFNYGDYVVHNLNSLKKEDPETYQDIDGDFLVKGAIEEAEWLFPRNSNFLVEDISKEGKYTIISGRIT